MPAIDHIGPGQCRQKIKTTNLSQFFEHRDPKPHTVSSTIQPVRLEVKRIRKPTSGNLAGALAFRKRNSQPQLMVDKGAGFDSMGFCEPLNVAGGSPPVARLLRWAVTNTNSSGWSVDKSAVP